MLEITNKTIGVVFREAVNLWPNKIFFVTPKTKRSPTVKLSYIDALRKVIVYEKKLIDSGYGFGERVALLLGNKVDHYLIKLAANNLGISVVPINPDLSPNEILYILNDSKTILTFTNQVHLPLMKSIEKISLNSIKFCNIDDNSQSVPSKTKKIDARTVTPNFNKRYLEVLFKFLMKSGLNSCTQTYSNRA